jgi:adenylate cyclase
MRCSGSVSLLKWSAALFVVFVFISFLSYSDVDRFIELESLIDKMMLTDVQKTQILINEGVALATALGDEEELVRFKLHQVYLELTKGQYADAILQLEALAQMLSLQSNSTLIGRSYNAYGQLWMVFSEYQRAQDAFEMALEAFHDYGDARGVAQATHNLGVVYASVGGLDRAVGFYLEALETFEQMNQLEEMADVYSNLGDVYAHMQQREVSLNYYNEALAIYEEKDNFRGMAQAYTHMGSFFTTLGLYEQAASFFDEAINYYVDLNHEQGLADVAVQLGVLYEQTDQMDRAIAQYMEAITHYKSLSSQEGLTVALNNLGTVYFRVNDLEKAVDYHLNALENAQEITYKLGILSALRNLSLDYQALGDYERSNEYMAIYLELNDYLLEEATREQAQNKQVLYDTQKKERALILEQAAKEVLEVARRRLILLVVLMTLVACIIGFLLVLVYKERKKSEKLLLNILPKKVAQRLKKHGKSESERFDEVTVYFSDVVNFTQTSASLEPDFLISELNDIFTLFDNVMEKHGCERIKTIGDAYLAVCGMPNPVEDHAYKMVCAAREIREVLKDRNKTAAIQWHIRIGIHTGSVVGGIVGIKKYIYDVFGDTINTASRMESNSEPMHINVSHTTYEKLDNRMVTRKRNRLEVKGKGSLQMYFVD